MLSPLAVLFGGAVGTQHEHVTVAVGVVAVPLARASAADCAVSERKELNPVSLA